MVIAHVILDLPPLGNRYWRHYRGRVTLSEEAKTYKDYVRLTLGTYEPCAGPVAVTVRVYRKRRAGDLDGYLKVLLDSLQGHLYENDSQITVIHAYRHDDKHAPRVVVTVEAVAEVVKPARRARRKVA